MAGASTAGPFLRVDPAPLALTQADVPWENKHWWESVSAALGTMFEKQGMHLDKRLDVWFRAKKVRGGHGWKRSVRLHEAEGSRFLPHTEKWFPYSF